MVTGRAAHIRACPPIPKARGRASMRTGFSHGEEAPMLYMMLVFQNEQAAKMASRADLEESERIYAEFHSKMRQRGGMEAAVRLRHADTATTVRVRSEKSLITDGPYAETKEQLGGFYFFECDDLDEAIELAGLIPTAESGAIEIRPVYADYTLGDMHSDLE
jgi:hypothetical protein